MMFEIAPVVVGIPVSEGRVCSFCGNLLPATTEYFSPARSNPIGLSTRCKSCANWIAREAGHERTRQRREWDWQQMTPAQRDQEMQHRREYAEQKSARSQKHKDSLLASSVNTRSRIYGDGKRISGKDVADIRKSQTDKKGRLICWRCRSPITDKPELDHFIPLAKGGSNVPGNLHFMHYDCNRSKRAIHPHDLGMLI